MGWKDFFKPKIWKIIILAIFIIFTIILKQYTVCDCEWSIVDESAGKNILTDYAKDTIYTQWFIIPTLLLNLMGISVPIYPLN